MPRLGASSWTPPESVNTSVGNGQQAGELAVGQRFGDEHVGFAVQRGQHRLAHHRVLVRGKDNRQFRLGVGDPGQRASHAAHGIALVFAAVGGNQQDSAAAGGQLFQPGVREGELFVHRGQKGINHRVAGHDDVLGLTPSRSRFSLLVEVGARCRRAIWLVILRLASSGNGESRSPLRSPASTCTTGMPW